MPALLELAAHIYTLYISCRVIMTEVGDMNFLKRCFSLYFVVMLTCPDIIWAFVGMVWMVMCIFLDLITDKKIYESSNRWG